MENTILLNILADDLVVSGAVAMAALGILFAVALAVAGKYLKVEIDPRIEKITELLPGANCGGCGYAGCAGYAEAVVKDGVDPSLCAPGGGECARMIAAVMGLTASEQTKKYAVVQCQGCDSQSQTRFDYAGVRDCAAANMTAGGGKACMQGCLGFGNCARACPFGAIVMRDGLPVILEEKCVACGKCVEACPRNIVTILPSYNCVHVRCLNTDKGAQARKICNFACISCKKCEKVCKFDAVHVQNFLACFDYNKCVSCGACVKECPQSCIVNVRKERKDRGDQVVKPKEKKDEKTADSATGGVSADGNGNA